MIGYFFRNELEGTLNIQLQVLWKRLISYVERKNNIIIIPKLIAVCHVSLSNWFNQLISLSILINQLLSMPYQLINLTNILTNATEERDLFRRVTKSETNRNAFKLIFSILFSEKLWSGLYIDLLVSDRYCCMKTTEKAILKSY